MARRIALIVITLVAVLLGTVAVPLGLLTASQDRDDFRDETIAAAATIANTAEEHLDDHATTQTLDHQIARLGRHGDQVSVYDANGRRVAGSRALGGVPPAWRTATSPHARQVAGRMVVVAPVTNDAGSVIRGYVVLSRSTASLDHRLAVLWTWLGLVSAAGLVAAALIAAMLARWVSRPLGALESAAQRLGDGDFEARSPASAGPAEVRALSANFNRMAARLETLVSGHQAMMADVSHQLRTPLAALRLRLDVLTQDVPDHLADELTGAQDEVVRLSRMVDGLLAVARAENVTTAPVAVPVQAVIRDRAAAWRPAAEERSVDLGLSVPEQLTARMGEGHLEQILDNLLANALEAVPAGGRIQLSAASAGDRIRILVADDGPGMSAQQQRSAFRRFVSATPGGTGIGLAIVHRLVTSDGGTVELSDTHGGGLTVTLDVPAVPRERTARRPGIPSAAGPRSLAHLKDS